VETEQSSGSFAAQRFIFSLRSTGVVSAQFVMNEAAGENASLRTNDPMADIRRVAVKMAQYNKILASGIALTAGIHLTVFGYFLFRTAITAPFADMFDYIAAYLRFREGAVGLLDYLWQPHADVRLVWIRLLTMVDVEIFHTKGIPFIAVATGALLLTAVLVWYQVWRAQLRLRGPSVLGLLAPMLILSTANVIDCSIPINTTYPVAVFFIVLTLVLFAGADRFEPYVNYRRAAGVIAALGAGLTAGAGLLAWPILLWSCWQGRVGVRWMAIIIAAGASYMAFYLHNLPVHGLATASQMDIASYLGAQHLGKLADYFLAFLGLPFSYAPALGFVGRAIGAVLLLAGLFAVFWSALSPRASTPLDRIAIGMILLALGSAALATVGRADLLDEVKLPVHYAIFMTALHVGLFCLVLPRLSAYCGGVRGDVLQNAVGLIVAVLLLTQQIFVGRAAALIANARAMEADCFVQGVRGPQISEVITQNQEAAEQILLALRRNGLLDPSSARCTLQQNSPIRR
jgi:hypothetical protein